MKKKKLVIFFLAIISLFFIYKLNYNETKTYLSLGDSLAKGHTPFDTFGTSYTDYLFDYLKNTKNYTTLNTSFIEEDLRIKDLILLIKSNEIKNGITLSSIIKNADLITLSIGSEEIFSKLRSNELLLSLTNNKIYEIIDEMFIELNDLIKEMRLLTKKPIYLIGLYNIIEITDENETKIDSIFNYLKLKYQNLEKEYKIYYVDIYEGFKNNENFLPNKKIAYPSLEGYNYINEQIIEKIKSN